MHRVDSEIQSKPIGQRKRYAAPIVPGADPNAPGLRCVGCGCGHFRVVATRRLAGGRIGRRRECRHCRQRITTIESSTELPAG